MRRLALALVLLLLAVPATALEPGPDDGLSPAEYERRMIGWCEGLTANYGWSWVPGWEDDPFSPVCTRPDDRGLSWQECRAAGWEWDCPPPSDPAAAPTPEPEPEPSAVAAVEPEPEPGPTEAEPAVVLEPAWCATDWHAPCNTGICLL